MVVDNHRAWAAVLSPAALSVRDRLEATGRLTPGSGWDLAALPAPVRSDVDTGALLDEDRG
jgi:hypothetical protein